MLGDRDRPSTRALAQASSLERARGSICERARSLAAIALISSLVALACTPTPSSQTPGAGSGEPRDTTSAAATPTVRTANPDRRGFDHQPDYEGEAAALREYVDGRLTAAPRDRKAACAAMFAAVDAFYESVEYGSELRRREVAAALAESRAADDAACQRETSAKAAACVSALLGDRSAEFPWLLDQCSRAYPLGPAS